jgi:hypothetical protein
MSIRTEWRQLGAMLIALVSIAAIAVAGGLIGHLIGPPKTFALIAAAMGFWLIAGWFVGGLRAVLAGLAILSAALAASNGTHALAIMLSGAAFLLLFIETITSDAGAHLKSLD